MADTEQAAAGVEAGPGELRPPRPPLARLLLEQLDRLPPLPAAAREAPRRVARDLARHGPAYLYGLRAALVVALLGWLTAAALVLVLWASASPAGASPAVPLQVSGQLWLAAHHVLLHAPDGPFGLSPLGFTLLPLLGLLTAGRRTARRRPEACLRASVGAAVGYALCACLIAASCTGGGLVPDYAQVLLYPGLIALLGHAAGAATVIRSVIPRMEAGWLPAAGRAVTGGLCVYLGAAALLAACFCVLHADELYFTQTQISGGLAGEAGLFLIDLALVPNAVLWGASVLAGPGFALGTGTSVTLFSVTRGPLPGLPLLAATPASQQPGYGWLALFLVPLAAGAVASALIARRTAAWPDRITAAAATAAAGGLALALAEMYAGGPVAFGPISVVGSSAWLVGALTSAQLLLSCAAALGARYLWPAAVARLRRMRTLLPQPPPRMPRPLRLPQLRTATAGPGVPEPAVEEAESGGSALDDEGVAELVGEGLVLLVPDRPQEADVAGDAVQDVAELPADGKAEAGDLAGVLADEPDAEDLLADGLPGGALPVELPELDAEDEQDADDHPDGLAAAAGDGPVGVDGDGLDAAEVDPVEDPAGDQDEQVDDVRADPLPPAGEGA
jgi:hypothetical protein